MKGIDAVHVPGKDPPPEAVHENKRTVPLDEDAIEYHSCEVLLVCSVHVRPESVDVQM